MPRTLSRILPIALDGMLPACLTNTHKYIFKLLPTTLQVHSQLHLLVCSQVHPQACFQGPSQLHLMAHSQRHSQAHSHALSQVLSQLHLMTLPVCLTVHSQVRSLGMPNYTSKLLSITIPSTLSCTLPIALHGTLPARLALRPQVHSPCGRHPQSHLTTCFHVCSCMLNPETGWVTDTRYRKVWPRWHVVGSDSGKTGSRQCAVCGTSQAAYIGWNSDVGQYGSLNLIISAPTMARSHNASRSWCWQLQWYMLQERLIIEFWGEQISDSFPLGKLQPVSAHQWALGVQNQCLADHRDGDNDCAGNFDGDDNSIGNADRDGTKST